MNPRVRALWLTALRSGRYVQGRNKLSWVGRDGQDHHCCLGVLCEVARLDGVPLTVTEHDLVVNRVMTSYRRYNGADNFLPPAVVEWAELDDHDVVSGGDVLVEQHDDGTTLSSLNDVGRSYDEIADVIEAQL